MKFILGSTLLDKFHVIITKIFGCSHPDNMVCDLGDEDYQYWFCFNCQKKLN